MVYTHTIKLHLTKYQLEKIAHAIKHGTGCTLRVEMDSTGPHTLPVSERQHNKLMKEGKHDIELSKTHINHIKTMIPELKSGGIIPLLPAIIGAIAAALGGVGGLAKGISSSIAETKATAETARHNREVEKRMGDGLYLRPQGKGLYLHPPATGRGHIKCKCK